MQVHHVGYRVRGFYRLAKLGHLWEMTPKDAQERLKILRFWERHGLQATIDAFGVSRRTLYRWKKALREAGFNPAALAARSCAPKRRRTPKTDPRLVAEIRRLRTLHPNLGKDKLHVLLAPWCKERGIALPSVSTIGRIIARAPDKMRHAPQRIDTRAHLKPLRSPPKPRKPKAVKPVPWQCLAVDTVERVRDGVRRYLLTFIDPASRFAFAVALPGKASRYTSAALNAALSLLPQKPEVLLSDNGSEFEAGFAQRLHDQGIQRWYTYPKTPKMNAHVERFNRTVQESFVDYHEDLLFTDLKLFNQKLADWLVFYNTQRPHHRLGQRTPLSFLLQHHPECQRWWTHTPRFQGIVHAARIAAMERVRIVSLKGLSRRQESIVREGQREAARVWNSCRDLHLKARHEHAPWPGRNEDHSATRGGRFALHSQTIQQVFRAFDAAVDAARENRRNGRKGIRYPYKDKRFFPLMWPAQAMHLEAKRIVLPMGRGRPSLVFPRPEWLTGKAACKVVWNGVHYELHMSVEEMDSTVRPLSATEKHATVDLGQIHQAAVVTNTGEALVVSGRGLRSLKRLHSKQLGEIQKKRSRCTKGSRRWRKLGRARAKRTLRYQRRVRDLHHKGIRQVVDFCRERGIEALFVGNPDGVRRNRCGRHQNQRMSQWEYGRDIDYLKQKAAKDRIVCFTGDERGTSSRCPVCGHRQKPKGRNWRCKACGFEGHRDIVGAVNMHQIAYDQVVPFPKRITYLRPGPVRSGQAAGMKNRQPGSSSRLGTGLPSVLDGSCLAESRNQAPQRTVPLRVPSGNSPRTASLG